MAKNRVIPFGYCMKNGEITVDFNESKAVIKIFEEYLGGSSLLQIAKLMESKKSDIVKILTSGTRTWSSGLSKMKSILAMTNIHR